MAMLRPRAGGLLLSAVIVAGAGLVDAACKCDNLLHFGDPIGGRHLDVYRSSVVGLLRVYDFLDPRVIEASSVASSQAQLQQLLLSRACAGCSDWQDTFKFRIAMVEHPLR